MIWLTEVAPSERAGKRFLDYLADANNDANPELSRLALKLATGAGKTTVMAMLIAWQTVNAVRRPQSRRFTRGFLVVTPGITIKDRLRVLQPNDPDSYYASRELVPGDMLDDVNRAKIVITNYHAFKRRERVELSKGGRALLQGRVGEELDTLESEGQMLQRVMPELMGLKNILVLNDEAHHCYREKPGQDDDEDLKGDDRKEAERNNEAARLWISGLEAVQSQARAGARHRPLRHPVLPARLRLRGGHALPVDDERLLAHGRHRVRHREAAPRARGREHPRRRHADVPQPLGEHPQGHAEEGPRQGRRPRPPRAAHPPADGAPGALRPLREDVRAVGAGEDRGAPVLHRGLQQHLHVQAGLRLHLGLPPRGTTTAPSGFEQGRLALFRNFDEHGNPLPRPSTLLIDSEQLESGEALDDDFRDMAADEIERFRREIVERTGDRRAAESLSDQDLLREVMNTVGRQGRLGGSIRCVVSVSMLTEGWDANTVTHVLGVRAFGTQLLCEQVIGRALRRQSYDLNDEGLFNVEYADVLGIPFDFTAQAGRRAAPAAARDGAGAGRCAPSAMPWRSASPAWRATAWSCRRSG